MNKYNKLVFLANIFEDDLNLLIKELKDNGFEAQIKNNDNHKSIYLIISKKNYQFENYNDFGPKKYLLKCDDKSLFFDFGGEEKYKINYEIMLGMPFSIEVISDFFTTEYLYEKIYNKMKINDKEINKIVYYISKLYNKYLIKTAKYNIKQEIKKSDEIIKYRRYKNKLIINNKKNLNLNEFQKFFKENPIK